MKVVLAKDVVKKLNKIPSHVKVKLRLWIDTVRDEGLEKTRLISSYHDEPLKGQKLGRRSIRLNRQWRAEYILMNEEIAILILEVHPHDY